MTGTGRCVLLVDPLGAWAAGPLADLNPRPVLPHELAQHLQQAGLQAVLVASDLGDAGSGVDLIRETVVRQGCEVPLILLAPSGDHALTETALLAGAASCVDLSRLLPRDLASVIELARTNRLSVQQRNAHLLHGLATYLSHEGRNALAGIRSGVQVVSDHLPQGSPDRALCGEVLERVLQFAGALDSLTLLLRPQNVPIRGSVPLTQVLREESKRLPPSVVTKIEGADVPVHANRDQIGLLFGAMLTNAAEAVGGQGQVSVNIKSEAEWCVVTVLDTESELGADATNVSHMLDLFTTSQGLQAGLGLPVAKRIAEAHGGSLELSCTPASALRVTVRLPLAKP